MFYWQFSYMNINCFRKQAHCYFHQGDEYRLYRLSYKCQNMLVQPIGWKNRNSCTYLMCMSKLFLMVRVVSE